MKDQLWEKKFAEFKNEGTEASDIRTYIEEHKEEIINAFEYDDSGTDVYPRDCVETFTLNKNIAGCDLRFTLECVSDRDGGNEEEDVLEFEINGRDCRNPKLYSEEDKLESLLADLAFERRLIE